MSKKKTKKEFIEKDKKSSKKIVNPVDVKYLVTFLTNQMFIGVYKKKGTSMEVPKSIAKAYRGRTTLEFKIINS